MSPRAAWRLESLGFQNVYDYVPGKSDWTARGLPTEGDNAGVLRPGALAERDVVTCRTDESIEKLRPRLAEANAEVCVVTTDEGVILGRIRERQLKNASDEDQAGAVMEAGPSTVRYDEEITGLVGRMQKKNVGHILVSDPDGRLIGIMSRERAVQALHELHEHHHQHHEN